MDKVYIIFWTQGGNTGAMASAIGDGVKAAGKEPVFLSPSEAKVSEVESIIIGGKGIIAHEMPQDDDIELCKDLGKQLAEL